MNRRVRKASSRGNQIRSPKTRNLIEPKWTRKNIVIDQHRLDLAKTLLRAPTETATVDQALDLIAFQKEVLSGIERSN